MPRKKYNKALYKFFLEDQKSRGGALIRHYKAEDWRKLAKEDKKRREKVLKILRVNKNLTARDYFMAAMIFQHGTSLYDSKKAVALARKSMEHGEKDARWLYAAATDRLLTRQGRKQKFGTQYQKKNNRWFLYPVDKRTSDNTRVKYDVIPLSGARKRAQEWNRDKIDPWEQKRKKMGITQRSY